MNAPAGKPHRIAIVADDLTGACDAAVAFAPRAATYVGLHSDSEPPAGWQAYSINTDTRCSAPEIAAERTARACSLARRLQPQRIVKKIDSLMRGSVAAEIAAARAILEPRLTLLAPAFPALGRIVRGGEIRTGDGSEPIGIAGRLKDMRCAVLAAAHLGEAAARCAQAAQDGIEILIADAEDEEQMRLLARAADGVEGLLWAGSGGLTRAVAAISEPSGSSSFEFAHSARTAGPPGKPLLICAGSDHEVTQAQLDDLRRSREITFAEAGARGYAAANTALRDGHTAVLLFSRSQLNADAARRFAEALRVEHCGGLLLTGGDTAIQILDGLDAAAIRLRSELLPGIPLGEILGGKAAGVATITKSGAFGAPDALTRCVEIFESRQAAPECH